MVMQYYNNAIIDIQKVYRNLKYLAIILPNYYLKHRKKKFKGLLNSKRLLERKRIGKIDPRNKVLSPLKMVEGKIYPSQDFLTSASFLRFSTYAVIT